MKHFAKRLLEQVIENGRDCGGEPSVFDGSAIKEDILSETINALLQTRAGGTVLVLLTPLYFDDPMRCMEFKTIFNENSGGENTLKSRFFFVDCVRDDSKTNTNAAYMLNAYLGNTHIHTVDALNFSQATSEIASNIWREWRGDDSSDSSSLPTIFGRTRMSSMNHLSRSFEGIVEDISTYFQCGTSQGALAVFYKAITNNRFTYRDVDPLLKFCRTSVSHGRAERINYVQAYKKKWTATDCLEWGPEKFEELRVEYNNFRAQTIEMENNSHVHGMGANATCSASSERLALCQQDVSSVYIVRPCDTLYIIAQKKLGDASRWQEIYELNKDILRNPDFIIPDMRLKLPH